MTRLADGSERLLAFDVSVPLGIVAPLMAGVEETLRREGWTDIRYRPDDGSMQARPPGAPPAPSPPSE